VSFSKKKQYVIWSIFVAKNKNNLSLNRQLFS
jgi:hypothetical protein